MIPVRNAETGRLDPLEQRDVYNLQPIITITVAKNTPISLWAKLVSSLQNDQMTQK